MAEVVQKIVCGRFNISSLRLFAYFSATFLIPYFLALFLVAIPMLVLEAVLGHLMQKGCLTAWNLTPIFRGMNE